MQSPPSRSVIFVVVVANHVLGQETEAGCVRAAAVCRASRPHVGDCRALRPLAQRLGTRQHLLLAGGGLLVGLCDLLCPAGVGAPQVSPPEGAETPDCTLVQMNAGVRLDHFAEMPISLVMLLLICMDLVERMRPYRLLGQSDDMDLSYELPVLTNLEMVSSVSNQLYGEENGAPANYQPEHQSKPVAPRRRPDTPAGRSTPIPSRTSGGAYLYKSSRAFSGKLGFLVKRDSRSHEFVDCFLFWFDTVEMLRVAGEPTVFYSAWVYPVFVLAFLSSLRVILAPDSPFLSLAGVVLQDFPFLILRLSLMAVFGLVTPVLFPVKNALVSLTFVYFTCMTRMKIFKRHEMF
ncbi:transmembrane protein 236 isoform X2 [Corythoichthys intestinalis]|uniref:transmembrane protein 236 isoform X2 n=1 Tax=Corythoichthys intestinalis TaxID=161448 RepID=UPI0025A67742|nr:transmembrane protein 236 isoform X2 [Corythoichthys intestinalis]